MAEPTPGTQRASGQTSDKRGGVRLGSHPQRARGGLTSAWLVHRPTRGPLVLVGVVPFDAGQVRHSVVAAHYEDEAEHDANAEVDPLICHGGYHFPGILAGIVAFHAGGHSRVNEVQWGRLHLLF